MVNEFGIDNPIGKKLYKVEKKFAYEIVGVVNDFHVRSLRDKIEPVMLVRFVTGNLANIKIASANIPTTLKVIESEWKSVWGPAPFNYEFLDETFDRQYRRDEQLATAIGYFTILAIVIACLGLFALSSFTVSRRIKEIGVRKAFGASSRTLVVQFMVENVMLTLAGATLAFVLSGFLLRAVNQSEVIPHAALVLNLRVFVWGVALALAFGLLSGVYPAWRMSRLRPVDALKGAAR